MGQRYRHPGQPLPDRLARFQFVPRRRIGVQIAHGYGLDILPLKVVQNSRERVAIQRPDGFARRVDAFFDIVSQRPRN